MKLRPPKSNGYYTLGRRSQFTITKTYYSRLLHDLLQSLKQNVVHQPLRFQKQLKHLLRVLGRELSSAAVHSTFSTAISSPFPFIVRSVAILSNNTTGRFLFTGQMPSSELHLLLTIPFGSSHGSISEDSNEASRNYQRTIVKARDATTLFTASPFCQAKPYEKSTLPDSLLSMLPVRSESTSWNTQEATSFQMKLGHLLSNFQGL